MVHTPRVQTDQDRLLGDVRAWREHLAAQQARLGVQVAALDRLLSVLGSSAPTIAAANGPQHSERRGLREGSLKSYIDQVLRTAGGPMRVVEIKDAVLKAGYKTKNKTLARSVGVALAEMPGVEKVGRGTFQAA